MLKKPAKFFPILSFFCLCLVIVSCTITPVTPKSNQPSFDNNVQNSGFVMFLDDGSGLISTNAASRYNFLISIYKNKFIPPITENYGLTFTNIQNTNYFIISAEGIVNFGKMNHWKKNQIIP